MTCPDCERHKLSASMWRNEAYKHAGTPLPWKPEELLREEYERGFIDGMQKQMQSSVDKAVNAMAQPEQKPVAWLYIEPDNPHLNVHYDDVDVSQFPHDEWFPVYKSSPQRTWVGLTDEEIWENDSYKVAITDQETRWLYRFARAIEAKLKEKNT